MYIRCYFIANRASHFTKLYAMFSPQAMEAVFRQLSSKLENFILQYQESFQIDSEWVHKLHIAWPIHENINRESHFTGKY